MGPDRAKMDHNMEYKAILGSIRQQSKGSWMLGPFWVPGLNDVACTTNRFGRACMELLREPEPKVAPIS